MRLNHRALGISTILLSLWLLVLPPVSAAGAGGNSSDAGVPPTIPGLVPGKANASVAVSVILSQAPALAAPAPSRVSIQSAVAAQQGSFEARARALDPSVRVVSSQSQLLNRVTVSVPRRLLGKLQAIPGVTKVFAEHVYHAAMDVAPAQIDALAAAEASAALSHSFANAGQGIKIGIIDTGIDSSTPFLTDTATPALGIPGFSTPMPGGFPKGVTTFQGAPVTTRKVIAARYFCDDTFDIFLGLPACSNPGDPRGVGNGHGTHVAGIAAGNYHTNAGPAWGNVALSGEAPAAWLGAYKVLDHDAQGPLGPQGTSSEIAAGVEQAVMDGMDVLNLSLGGGGEADDVAGLAVEQAAKQGVVVAVAAGNSGPGSFQVGSPGAEPDILSVAATVSNKSVILSGSVSGSLSGTWEALNDKGGYNAIGEPALPPTPITYGGSGNYQGSGFTTAPNCPIDPTPTAATGTVLVIERGCSALTDKAHNAQVAGAAAVIIVSQADNPAISFAASSTQTIPVYITNRSTLVPPGFSVTGQQLVDASKTTHPLVSVNPTIAGNLGGHLAGFSSPGPLRDETLKPDVAAPGTLILSSAPTFPGSGEFDPSHFTYLQGTSMATPQVAGSAALLESIHPDWSVQDIRSALQTTGRPVPVDDTGSRQAATWQVGGGQIDDLAASSVGAAASPSSLSFGKRNAATQDRFHAAIDVSLSSLSGQYERYQVSVVPDPGTANPGITTPSFVGAPDKNPGSFTVALNTHATQAEPRIRYSGLIVLKPVRGGPDLKLPYLFTSINFPIAPGSTLLIDDSGHDRTGASYDDPAASPPSNPSSKLDAQIAATGRTVEYWDRLFYGEPSLSDLNAARSVVWSFETDANDLGNLTNNGTLSSTELETMRAYLDGGGRLDVFGQIFAEQVVLAFAALPPTGTVVPDDFATADAFLQDRFGIDVLNDGVALDPAGGGLPIQGLGGDPIGNGIAGTLAPSFFGGRDTIALVGTGKPTFFADPAQSIGSNIIGDRTAYEPELRGPGNFSRGRPGRTTFETFSTADLAGPVGVLARSHILDWLEDDVSVLASASGGDPMTVQVYAASGKGIVTAYRYDFGDGSPMLETGSPTVTHHVASGGRAGPVVVSATDSLGHVGLGEAG
ncbi:MAG: PKD domain-containing protein [Actinobacteria bacterium]|nr:MAG: PKD domain-containing protein [Actinomycetota bacterium]